MLILQTILMVGGILLFALGYWKTKRNPMLLGAILFVSGLGLTDFVDGFAAGFAEGARNCPVIHPDESGIPPSRDWYGLLTRMLDENGKDYRQS